jgi:hypothetical protein
VSLLAGPVAFIDDELTKDGSQAAALLREIQATGRPVAWSLKVPEDRDAWFEHWQSLAFVVLDWDLVPGSGGATGSSTLSQFERKKLFDFVTALLERIYCPVFIISAEDTADITRQLLENKSLLMPSGELDARIAVFPKELLMNNIVEHLTTWLDGSPALSALRAWEQQYDSAKNRLFIELNEMSPDWPVYVWTAADSDQVDPAFELASVISTNLLNRFDPVVFNEKAISGYAGPTSGSARRRVAQGRTTVPASKLSTERVLPGDMFQLAKKDEGEVWLNVSPACHTVGRLIKTNKDGTEVREPVRLQLIRGERLPQPTTEGALKDLEKGRSNSIVLHTVLEESPYVFRFGEAQILEWDSIKGQRVGRLLPPFITRIQQMHAAYIQSAGLPKVTFELYAPD